MQNLLIRFQSLGQSVSHRCNFFNVTYDKEFIFALKNLSYTENLSWFLTHLLQSQLYLCRKELFLCHIEHFPCVTCQFVFLSVYLFVW